MSIVKRNVNDETFGQDLSDVTVLAFQNKIHCDALIISGDGGEIRAHQVFDNFLAPQFHLNSFLYFDIIPRVAFVCHLSTNLSVPTDTYIHCKGLLRYSRDPIKSMVLIAFSAVKNLYVRYL